MVFIPLVLVGRILPVLAHDAIPSELLEYLEQHPDASMEEIEVFLAASVGQPEDQQQKMQLLKAIRMEQRSFGENAFEFIHLGILHILEGLDHVLFVLAIVLTFTSLRTLLKLITAFTVAHSITLIVAGMHWFSLTSSIVEPIIALSIAYVALTTVFLRRIPFFATTHSKVLTIFLFGLFHGLGFAGLLTDLSIPSNKFLSSLLFFNVGIEIGQLIILAVAIPILLWIRKHSWNDVATKTTALGISAVAIFWFFERL